MMFGLTPEELDFLKKHLIYPIKNKKAKVFIFGSRATNRYKKFSDIDLLFIPHPDEPIPGHFTYPLLSKIEDSNFPYKIDLVNYNELAKSYKQNVDKEKIEIF